MAEYSGNWHSKKYTAAISSGSVKVNIPHDFDSNSQVEHKLTADIKYFGMYRLRQQVQIPVVLKGLQAVSQNFQTPEWKEQNIAESEGTLEFTVTKVDGGKMYGTFRLSKPEDYGEFEIQPGSSHGRTCIIS